MSEHTYAIKMGLDRKRYAVFANSYERDTFIERNPDCELQNYRPACFGQFDNAVCLDEPLPR